MNFAKHFLLSTDNLRGSFFAGSVILMCRHDEDGAFGIVVNKPSPTKVRDLLRALRIQGGEAGETETGKADKTGETGGTGGETGGEAEADADAGSARSDSDSDSGPGSRPIYISPDVDGGPVMQGGPVKPEQVFVLHSPERDFEATIKVDDNIAVTLSRDILSAIAEGKAPRKILFAFGYAGWGVGQLEDEISQNAWVLIPASPDLVFDLPAEGRLPAALKRVGFDITKLADAAGNA